jgi:hypothetical protein
VARQKIRRELVNICRYLGGGLLFTLFCFVILKDRFGEFQEMLFPRGEIAAEKSSEPLFE